MDDFYEINIKNLDWWKIWWNWRNRYRMLKILRHLRNPIILWYLAVIGICSYGRLRSFMTILVLFRKYTRQKDCNKDYQNKNFSIFVCRLMIWWSLTAKIPFFPNLYWLWTWACCWNRACYIMLLIKHAFIYCLIFCNITASTFANCLITYCTY